jgi:hypothetical protein
MESAEEGTAATAKLFAEVADVGDGEFHAAKYGKYAEKRPDF